MDNVLDWTHRVLATTPSRWQSLAQTLPVDLLTRPPAAGEWCALECLQHLMDSDAVFTARLSYFRAGQDFEDFNPAVQGTRLSATPAPREMAAQFARLRADSLTALAAVTPGDLDRRARHSALGMVSLGEMIHDWAAHDLQHTMQAERALMQPFIDGCGPWQVNLQDYWMKSINSREQ